MKRGDFVTVALQGESGKPRPALIVQADQFAQLSTVTVLPVTGTLLDLPVLRVTVEPSQANGLQKPSQIMISRPQNLPRAKVGRTIGHADEATMLAVGRTLAVYLGLGCSQSERRGSRRSMLR